MSLFKIQNYSKPEPAKIVYGGGKNKSEENIIKNVKNVFNQK